MNFNQTLMTEYIDTYKELYEKQDGVHTKNWWSFLSWLASFTPSGSFNTEDVEYAKELLKDKPNVKILSFNKIEERMCYDAWWMVITDQGRIKLHTYDGISNDRMKAYLDKCKTIEDIENLNAKCFYFD